MDILIIGSTQYLELMKKHKARMEALGHRVRLPCLDERPELDELGVCELNRQNMLWADEVHIIWDRRSMGTIFDFGMAFALRKPVRVIYLEQKTFWGVMARWEKQSHQ